MVVMGPLDRQLYYPHGASWRGGQVIAHFTLFVSSGCKSRLGKRRSAE